LHFTGQAQKLVRLTASGIFDRRLGQKGGFSPKPTDLPTREKEIKNEIDWQKVFGQFSCVMGHIWRARRKKTAAYFSDKQFGCPGGAFFLGFNKPQTETIIHWETARKKILRSKKAWGKTSHLE